MRPAGPEEHVHVHLARGDEERVGVAEGDDRAAMCEADAEGTVGDDFGEGEGRGVGCAGSGGGGGCVAGSGVVGREERVEGSSHELEVGRDAAEEVVGWRISYVA